MSPLPDWSPIAYVPIDPAGNGELFFPGKRAIPYDATHVLAHCVSRDFLRFEDVSTEIPKHFLHDSVKPDTVQMALRPSCAPSKQE